MGSIADTVKIETIMKALGATVLEGGDNLNASVQYIYASDLMSDVLAFGKADSILLTGLATQQAIISAHMAEFKGVVLIRGKRPKDGAEKYARDHSLVLLSTDLDMYDACIRIAAEDGIQIAKPDGETTQSNADDILFSNEYTIEGSDFAKAGMVSTEVKAILKKIGFDPKLVRRVAISTYEGEMNVVMHAKRAKVKLLITPKQVDVKITDEGKGIPDVEAAMEEGFTTSTEEMRAMGFGSGMGLPNIKRNSDELEVTSEVGKGTTLQIRFLI